MKRVVLNRKNSLFVGNPRGPRQEREKIYLVTMAALCFFIIAQ